jgi:hypothetical protein
MSFLVILDTISTATIILTKYIFTKIKSHHTFNQTNKIYTQTIEKILFLKLFFSNHNHKNYIKNKQSLTRTKFTSSTKVTIYKMY